MSSNLKQIFDANPASSMNSTDLDYLAREPFGPTDNFGISWENRLASIAAQLANLSAITGNINLNPTPANDLTSSSLIQAFTAGESLTFGIPTYINSAGKMFKADSELGGPLATHLALGTYAADATGSFMSYGFVRDDSWNWTVGGLIFLSTTYTLTQTAPVGESDAIQVLGVATHADRIFFAPYLFYVTPLGNSLVHATSAANARTALVAAASGANADITSLSGLTTPLSLAQGGTAGTNAATARASLIAAALGSNSDITALTGLTGAISKPTSITMATSGSIRTDTTSGNTFLLQVYDTDNVTYRTFITGTAGLTPTLALSAPSGGSLTGSFSTLYTDSTLVQRYFSQSTGTAINISTSVAYFADLTLDNNCTITLSESISANQSQTIVVKITQDGSGGHTLTWAGVTWLSGTAPVIASAAGSSLYVSFISVNGTIYGYDLNSVLNATNVAITDDTTTNATMYPVWVTSTTGNLPEKVSSTKMSFNPSTGLLTTTGLAATTAAVTSLSYTLNSNCNSSPTNDLTTSGTSFSGVSGENLVFGDVVYKKSDGKYWKADANAAGLFPAQYMCIATIATDATGLFIREGFARNDAWAWTVGGILYLSTTAGSMTQTEPSATDDCIQVLGEAISATIIDFSPSRTYLTHV